MQISGIKVYEQPIAGKIEPNEKQNYIRVDDVSKIELPREHFLKKLRFIMLSKTVNESL